MSARGRVLALCAALAAPAPAAQLEWPNAHSRANGDRWIVEHHDELRAMRPRLLVLNYSNRLPPGRMEAMTAELIRALAESSRYHGYADPSAPAFLQYEVHAYVDLRDAQGGDGNSSRAPVKRGVEGFNVDYAALYSAEHARAYGIADPARPGEWLDLAQLLDRGIVHEVWLYFCVDGAFNPYECIELKPRYGQRFERLEGAPVQAGNGGDEDQPWTGRSCRINAINHERGIGCAMENLGHALEGLSNSGAIPYYTRYFREYAELDLERRWKLPFDSLYALAIDTDTIEYPDPTTALVRRGAQLHRIEDYVVRGGNVHFPPNARRHYDLDNTTPVLATIEDWRIGSGPGGRDRAEPWTSAKLASYRELVPDCMGPWLVYWRQSMPGLDNRQKDDAGRPMKNWWPFLFY